MIWFVTYGIFLNESLKNKGAEQGQGLNKRGFIKTQTISNFTVMTFHWRFVGRRNIH